MTTAPHRRPTRPERPGSLPHLPESTVDRFHHLLHELWEGESRLAAELSRIAERFAPDRELSDNARHLARRATTCADLPARLIGPPGPVPAVPAVPAAPGRCPDPALAVLHALRRVHAVAGDNLLLWDALGGAAAVRGDRGVLELAAPCRPQDVERARWSRDLLRARALPALTGQRRTHRRQEAVRFALAHSPAPGDCAEPAAARPATAP
ncbi:hypothetical protein [Kitasatospora phosalacinea]|uniref:Uncharacterized protein n=1 Tax=Kitasatospora phosalacinea TaxID=2065 RepID=A0ABW6GM81_9ACTN